MPYYQPLTSLTQVSTWPVIASKVKAIMNRVVLSSSPLPLRAWIRFGDRAVIWEKVGASNSSSTSVWNRCSRRLKRLPTVSAVHSSTAA